MLTCQHPEDRVESIYKEIEKLVKNEKGYENLIITGHRNARIGCRKGGKVAGEHRG